MPVVVPLAAAAVGAIGTAYAASKASSAAGKAADAQTQANQAAIGEQQREYDTTRSDYAPWRAIGVGALQQLARTENIQLPASATNGSAYGFSGDTATQQPISGTAQVNGKTVYIGTPPPNPTSGTMFVDNSNGQRQLKVWDESSGRYGIPNPQQAAGWLGGTDINSIQPTGTGTGTGAGQGAKPYGDFLASPDYKFRYDEGQRAVTGNAAARGLLDSGATGHALINYGQGAASQEFGSWFNRIATLAGVGQAATNATTAAGTATAANVSGIMQNEGQQRASSYATQGGIQAGLINGLGNTAAGLITQLGQPKPAASSVSIPNVGGGGLSYTPSLGGAPSVSLWSPVV